MPYARGTPMKVRNLIRDDKAELIAIPTGADYDQAADRSAGGPTMQIRRQSGAVTARTPSPLRFVAIVGHGPDLEREAGTANVLRGLGAEVRTLDLWDEPSSLFQGEGDSEAARAIVIEAIDRPDLAAAALRALRTEPRLTGVGAIVAVSGSQSARLEPSTGFDDFVVTPCDPAELYARIRILEWRRSEFTTDERVKVGTMVIDRSAHDVTVGGQAVPLTAKEFALLAYLCDRRGKVVSRSELLARVWGNRYEGGERTVDIHVRRLRAKLGSALPLATLRGSGYKLTAPDPALPADEHEENEGQTSSVAHAAAARVSARTLR